MQSILDILLPSLASLGVWGYWVLALVVFLQGFAPTSPLAPGSVLVAFAGGLASQGVYDFWDLVWFVALADIIGAELSFRVGAKSRDWAAGRHWFVSPERLARVGAWFRRVGPVAVLLGRFVPMGAFVPLLAGTAGLSHRVFWPWNLAGGFAYALAGLGLGYLVGAALPAITAAAGLLSLIVLGLIVAIGAIWFAVVTIRRVMPFFASVWESVTEALAHNPDVQALVARHPRLFALLHNRLRRDLFSGLPTTVLALAFGYFAVLFVELSFDVMQGATIVSADTRLAGLFYALRDPGLVRFFSIVTSLGSWPSVLVLAATASALMWIFRRGGQALALWGALAGNQLTVTLLKHLFDRPRPEFAVYVEHSAAFPSGHAAASVVLYGFVAWALVGARVRNALAAVLAAVLAAFLIGFSRLYLVEHYLSDVLNGYLVGTLWLLAAIWWLERGRARARERTRARPQPRAARPVRLAVLGVGLAAVATVVAEDDLIRNVMPAPAPVLRLEMPLAQAFAAGKIAVYTETVAGRVEAPVSLVFLARDAADLTSLFAAAGWTRADQPGIETMSRAAIAAWTGQPYPTAPITPAFWRGRTQDFGFQRPTAEDDLRKRHHARVWDTHTVDEQGRRIFVGTASFDDGLKWGITHHIDPNIDAERNFLVKSVQDSGAVLKGWLKLTPPNLGENMMGDPYFTDGRASVIEVGPTG